MIRIAFVRSGSKGNATLIDSGNVLIQIDMGVTLTNLKLGCEALSRSPQDIEAVFYTHNHADHIKNAYMMSRFCPCFASRETIEDADFELSAGVGEQIGDITVIPFSVSHDAPDPLNFLILVGEERFAYITDTGYLSEENLTFLKDCDYYLIESNHDIQMERRSRRPRYLKERVLSDLGHLSNIDSALYMTRLIGPHTKGIYLGHISDDCNTHDIALRTHRETYEKEGIDWTRYDLRCTSQSDIVIGGDKK